MRKHNSRTSYELERTSKIIKPRNSELVKKNTIIKCNAKCGVSYLSRFKESVPTEKREMREV